MRLDRANGVGTFGRVLEVSPIVRYDTPRGPTARRRTKFWGVAIRSILLTTLATAYNNEGFFSRELAKVLKNEGEVLVRHWMVDDRKYLSDSNPDLKFDALDRAEFDAFEPDVVYFEGGLYWNKKDWRIPRDVLIEFVAAGGVVVVGDVGLNELTGAFQSYGEDLAFFGAAISGNPNTHFEVPYVRDESSKVSGNPAAVLCPKPSYDTSWTADIFHEVDALLAFAPVPLAPPGIALAWTAPTADILSMDRYVSRELEIPVASAKQHGLGYAALISAQVGIDQVVRMNPDNLRWLRNLMVVLHERASDERLLRLGKTKIPAKRTSPYSDREAADLATAAEDHFLEHKQTLLWDMKTKQLNAELQQSVIDRICGFWNAAGGTLLIGVADRTGEITGLDCDLKLVPDTDALVNRLSTKLHDLVPSIAPLVRIAPIQIGDKEILRIDVPPGDGAAVFLKERFLVRVNNST